MPPEDVGWCQAHHPPSLHAEKSTHTQPMPYASAAEKAKAQALLENLKSRERHAKATELEPGITACRQAARDQACPKAVRNRGGWGFRGVEVLPAPRGSHTPSQCLRLVEPEIHPRRKHWDTTNWRRKADTRISDCERFQPETELNVTRFNTVVITLRQHFEHQSLNLNPSELWYPTQPPSASQFRG